MSHVADNAHDLTPKRVGIVARAAKLEGHSPADGVLVGPELARHRLVDHRDERPFGSVARIEASSRK
jgi:hypothetical protein